MVVTPDWIHCYLSLKIHYLEPKIQMEQDIVLLFPFLSYITDTQQFSFLT